MEPFWEKMGLSTEPQMWRASELLDCLRQHRQDGILIYFFYQDAAYEVGQETTFHNFRNKKV